MKGISREISQWEDKRLRNEMTLASLRHQVLSVGSVGVCLCVCVCVWTYAIRILMWICKWAYGHQDHPRIHLWDFNLEGMDHRKGWADGYPPACWGILGTTGSGKSTILSLILRLYEPSSGQILLGGKDIKEYNPLWLRHHIGFVSQDTALRSNWNRGCSRSVWIIM